jgi:Tol biopolymer transport system component/DNA-binding winged helix-turn-helix (wHTH) protein
MSQQNHYVYEFGPFHLDATKRVLLKEGEPLKLFPKEFDTLLALVERSGELLGKDDLLRTVWHDSIVEESNLATNISHLRKVLGETRDKHDYIVTVPGRGYRFVAGVTQSFDEVIVRDRARITLEESDEREVACADPSNGTQPSGETHSQSLSPLKTERRPTRWLDWVGNLTKPNRLRVVVGLMSLAAAAVLLSRFIPTRTHTTPFQNVKLTQLTTNSKSTLATLSPDGKLFIYVARESGREGLWLGHVGGGTPISLRSPEEVTYRNVTVSPDGANLYYVIVSDEYRTGALFRMPVFGGVPEKVHENIGVKVAFNPNMEKFAFVRNNAEKQTSSVVIRDTVAGQERELVSRPGDLPFRSLSPSWSSDGTKVAVSAVTNPTGEEYGLFVVSAASGEIRPLTTLGWNHIASTIWLPDGGGLAMVARDQETFDGFQLWHVSYPDGKTHKILSDLDSYGSALSLSADGKALLAVQEQRINNVWVAQSNDLRQAKQITFSSKGRRDGWGSIEWTPQGKLLYGAIIRNSATIWTMNADGQEQKQLTSTGYRDSYVSTADGRFIVFQSNRSGTYEIWRSLPDGTDMKQLTSGGNNREPHLSPDGRWIVYSSTQGGLNTIWRVNAEGGHPLRLTDQPAWSPRISPDGKLLACGYSARQDPVKAQLAIISADGGPPIKLFDVPRLANFNIGIRWAPDGAAVTYRDWANGIWRQALTGGAPVRLSGLPEEKLFAYSWSQDGKQFAFVRGSEIRDVVLLRFQ